MFSPDATSQNTLSLRNPRRRPRNSSGDHLGSRHATKRRKRSSLTPSTFEGPSNNLKVNCHLGKANGDHVPKEQSPEPPLKLANITEKTSLAVRHKPTKPEKEKKAVRHAEGIVLTKCSQYVVTKEPNVPDEVHDLIRGKELWQARFNEDLGYAIIFTYAKAIIWRYSHSDSKPSISRVLTIKLPQIPIKPKDPLPLGTLVHDSCAGEVALLVLQHNGKINYWESVTSAAHADTMRQKQQGIHGSLSGLLSKEVVNDVANAEPDGFLLTTNAGRIIHLSVRDSQGKLAITTELLRGNGSISGGLFDGFRNPFSGSGWQKDIAAARCAPSKGKSHRKCVVVTKQCILQIWDFARHSAKTLDSEINATQAILDSVQPLSHGNKRGELQAIDFAFFPSQRSDQPDSQHILLLVGLKSGQATSFFLIELNLYGGTLHVNLVRPVTCYDQAVEDDRPWLAARSRVLLPHPAHTAIINFDTFYIMISLAQVEEGPSSQLKRESDLLSEPFQDVLFFTRDRDFHVVGCTIQSPGSGSDHASCLFLVNNLGLVQTSVSQANPEEPPSARRAALCRSKIEQAVFFGEAPSRLFDFSRNLSVVDWQSEEIEEAALQINDSILNSKSPYVSAINPSMEHQLQDRSNALKELIKSVNRWILKDSTKWQLLWSAEKMAAARAVWQAYSSHLSKRDKLQIIHNDEKILLLREALDMLSERHKHEARSERGETDVVRHYFVNDIANIELVVSWVAHALNELYREGLQDIVKQALLVNQANDIQISALETAYRFREKNAELYGIPRLSIEDGIYTGSYRDFPDIWTSCAENVVKVKDLAVLSRECAKENAEPTEDNQEELDITVLTKLASDSARLASLACQLFEERYRFLKDHLGATDSSAVSNFQDDYFATRRELIVRLVDVELPAEGIRIAEKYDDVVALADVMSQSLSVMLERVGNETTPEDEVAELMTKFEQYKEKIRAYFQKYGLRWADAYYTQKMRDGSVTAVLTDERQLMKEFLQSKPNLLKIKWMHAVGVRQDFKEALQDLLKVNTTENNIWNKKVELSMAKLSILAAKETQQMNEDSVQASMRHADRRLAAIRIQEQLYSFTRPLLRTALDHQAETDLAVESFAKSLKKRPVLAEKLRQGLGKLVSRRALPEEELIDTLTLMTCPSHALDDEDFAGKRFFLALCVVNDTSSADSGWSRLQQQLIWRRCILQDDWEQMNNTEYKADEAVTEQTEGTALFKTLLAALSEGLSDELPPLPPSELLGDEINPAALRASPRFHSVPDATLEALCKDLAAEASTLARVVEKGRLQLWWPGIVDAAKSALRRRRDAEGATLAQQEEEKRKIEAKLLGGELPNGLANGVHHSSSPESNKDGDGDVVMG